LFGGDIQDIPGQTPYDRDLAAAVASGAMHRSTATQMQLDRNERRQREKMQQADTVTARGQRGLVSPAVAIVAADRAEVVSAAGKLRERGSDGRRSPGFEAQQRRNQDSILAHAASDVGSLRVIERDALQAST